jgi:hypothetical protein
MVPCPAGRREGLKEPKGIGYETGIVFVLLAIQKLVSLIFNSYLLSAFPYSFFGWPENAHPHLLAMLATGLSVRTAVISTIFEYDHDQHGRICSSSNCISRNT